MKTKEERQEINHGFTRIARIKTKARQPGISRMNANGSFDTGTRRSRPCGIVAPTESGSGAIGTSPTIANGRQLWDTGLIWISQTL